MNQRIIRHIFGLAERLEPDRQIVWDWMFHTRIEVLGGHTPLELIFAEQGDRVIELLETALDEEAGMTLSRQLPSHAH